jgi:hypothetical protein
MVMATHDTSIDHEIGQYNDAERNDKYYWVCPKCGRSNALIWMSCGDATI